MSDPSNYRRFNAIEDTAIICGFISYIESAVAKGLNNIRQSPRSTANQVQPSKWSSIFYEDSAVWYRLIPISVFHIQRSDLVKIPKPTSPIVDTLLETILITSNSNVNAKEWLSWLDSADTEFAIEMNELTGFDFIKDLLSNFKLGIEELSLNLSYAAERHIADKIKSTSCLIDQALWELK